MSNEQRSESQSPDQASAKPTLPAYAPSIRTLAVQQAYRRGFEERGLHSPVAPERPKSRVQNPRSSYDEESSLSADEPPQPRRPRPAKPMPTRAEVPPLLPNAVQPPVEDYLEFSYAEPATTYIKTLGATPKPREGTKVNKHAEAAVEREMATRLGLKLALDPQFYDTLVDVGANARRTTATLRALAIKTDYHALVPQILPEDTGRLIDATSLRPLPSVCRCTFQQCQCIPTTRVLHLCVHSLYYFTPLDLARRLVCGPIVSIEHEFPSLVGTLSNGSIKYHLTDDEYVVTHARGNSNTYTHPVQHWRMAGSLQINPKVHITRGILGRVGDTTVALYQLMEGSAPPPHLNYRPLLSPITDRNEIEPRALTGLVGRTVNAPYYDGHIITASAAFYLLDGFALTRRDYKMVIIPKGLIGNLRLFLLGKVRDAATYQTTLARAKRILTSLEMPDDLLADSALYGTIAAFMCVEHEAFALGTAVAAGRRSWQRHALALQLRPLRTIHLNRWTALNLASFLPSLYYTGAISTVAQGAAYTAAAVVAHPILALTALPFLAVSVQRRISSSTPSTAEADAWVRQRRNDQIAPSINATVAHLASQESFPGIFKPKTAVHLAEGASISLRSLPRESMDNEDKDVLRLQGISMSTITPSAHPKTIQAMVSALGTRLLTGFPEEEDPQVWERLIARLKDPADRLHRAFVPPGFEFPDDPDELWQPFVERFPPGVQRLLEEAKLRLKSSHLSKHDLTVEAILKREKGSSVTIEGVEASDPRVVLAMTPEANSFISPWIYHYSVALFDHLSIAKSPYFNCGVKATAEELGAWHDRMTDHYSAQRGGTMYVAGDYSRCDGRQKRGALDAKKCVFKMVGIPRPVIQSIEMSSRIVGTMQADKSLRFKAGPPSQISGASWTTLGNFIVCSSLIDQILGPPGSDTYALSDTGDDIYLIGYAEVLSPFSEEVVNCALAPYGMKMSWIPTRDTAKVDYLSLIPYPTSDGTVFGPKIGRHLMRGGWTTSSEKADIYGAAVSLATSVSFIPFLRQFYEVHRTLARPTEEFRPKWNLAERYHDATPATYEFIERRYGLTAADEIDFCARLSQVVSLPAILNWPRAEELALVDQ